jgi:putative DNA primase/helicase
MGTPCARRLAGIAASTTWKRTPLDIPTGDVRDHFKAELALEQLEEFDPFTTSYDGEEGSEPKEQDKPNPSRFFDPHTGLLVLDLAEAVTQSITCGFGGVDERFYVYDGGVWVPNKGLIEAEIGRLLGNRYRNAHTRNAMDLIRYSPATPRITCDPVGRFINVANGMVDWERGTLVPHSPDHRSTVQLPVEYDPTATCPAFDDFLAEVLPGDCLPLIWELIGYTLYSGNPLHIAVLLYGKGRNGKGTLIRVLKHLLGEHNCSTVGLHELSENRFRAATLFGKLANLAGDLDSRWLANTAIFKAITGGDAIQGEYKYANPFDFTPWALPFYSTNRAFGCADSSEGWVARWLVVPFPTSFVGREHRGLDAKLTSDDELRGILAGGIAALPALMKRGRFDEPASVRDAKRAFVAASDAVRAWIDDQCELDPDAWTPRTDLYRAYASHTVSDGAKQLSAREFYNRVEQVSGIWASGHNGVRGLNGIRLLGQIAGVAVSPTPPASRGGKGREPATPATSPARDLFDGDEP